MPLGMASCRGLPIGAQLDCVALIAVGLLPKGGMFHAASNLAIVLDDEEVRHAGITQCLLRKSVSVRAHSNSGVSRGHLQQQ